ncbi:hypothetical protein FVEG_17738 [Fusarium verticillioides 7600]|uniref:Uncharacterized protein n=1 Tax=Gibberella moniliformis (strain M3125 / FGSC 7600) TaxID=334819 RepID=A0A139YC04_GIBM7|nr:hypothetical protein FVEG_17738 [Fusarium verticillioides 7600]KYG13798.1 hypothetical protein FVEG_17738 [Fusarium verticillioides 7600]
MSRLHYDPEFYELGASKIEAQKHVFPVGDVESRRKQIEDFIRGPGGQQQLLDNVEMLLHDAEASDGFKVKILHFRQKDSLGKQHGPGIVHVHGGGTRAPVRVTIPQHWQPMSLPRVSPCFQLTRSRTPVSRTAGGLLVCFATRPNKCCFTRP